MIVENTKVCIGRLTIGRFGRSGANGERLPPVYFHLWPTFSFTSYNPQLSKRQSSVFCAAEHWWWASLSLLWLIMQGAGSCPGEVSCPTTLPHLWKHISTLHTRAHFTLEHWTMHIARRFALSCIHISLRRTTIHIIHSLQTQHVNCPKRNGTNYTIKNIQTIHYTVH